jgi:hypothetical protein
MDAQLIAHMRARVKRCRELAKMINDPQAIAVLNKMADEGEADIAKLEAKTDD